MTYTSKYDADSENKDDMVVRVYLLLCLHNHLSVAVSESKEYPCCISNRKSINILYYISRPKQANNIMIKDVLKSFVYDQQRTKRCFVILYDFNQFP